VHLPSVGPAITRWGTEVFVDVKGENPPLKMNEEGRAATLSCTNDFATDKNRSELFIIEPRNRAFLIIGEPSNYREKNINRALERNNDNTTYYIYIIDINGK